MDPENDDPNDFALNGAHGDDVWLLAADSSGNLTRFIDRVEFVAGVNGESFGRWPNGSGTMFPMTERTFDAANSGPRFGPVIFSEIMFHPELPAAQSGLDANDLEFIEIFNTSSSAISLKNWEIGKGVDYRFPSDATIGAGQTLVILSFNPQGSGNGEKLAGVMAAYNFAPGTTILGGYSGSLDNTGERLRLFRPDAPPTDEPGFIPLLVEDEVRFSPLAPWPTDASGSGESLARQSTDVWSNDPNNWQSAAPTPGSTTFSSRVLADLTGDGFVDFGDLTILLANWDQMVSAGRGNLVDPLNTPINFQDLTLLLAAWTGPGPVGAAQAAVVGGDPVGDFVDTGPSVAVGDASYRRRDRRATDLVMGEAGEAVVMLKHNLRGRRRDAARSSPASETYGRLPTAAVDRAMAEEEAFERIGGRRRR
ncbi:MAG: lamin tail domain-containing protein [Planctomycetes bacterium]|nr:lamin tail domain-containing protein [Planctomycetota bacterium]